MKYIFLIILILKFSFVSVCAVENSEWTEVNPNNYVNFENVVKAHDVYGYIFILKAFNKGQYEPVNGRRIWYTLGQYTIDCSSQKYKIGVIDSYGYENEFINGDYNRYAKFQPIVKDTAVSAVSERLCKIK